jgi:TolB protein
MKPDGSGEKLLTDGSLDDGASWAASGRELLFQRAGPDGRPGLYKITLAGGDARRVATPQDASDPDWSGALD